MRRIGKYVVRGFLGRGGMARVYKVVQPAIGRICALKRLEPRPQLEAVLGKARLRALFEAEARTMAGLQHPNLVQVLDYGTAGGLPHYAMTFHAVNLGDVIGETYRAEAPSRVLRLDRAVEYTLQVLEGLARLHHAGVVHRDIKPFNLLLSDNDRVRIADFGLSKLRGERVRAPDHLKVGSPFYTAPEQEASPASAGPPADLFSAGVMLRRMLTGSLLDIDSGPPSRANPDLAPDWDAFFSTATARRPAQRFQSAQEMKQALKTLYARWKDRQDRICRMLPESADERAKEPAARPRRRVPVKIRPAAAKKFFDLDDLWRPERPVSNRFRTVGENAVYDAATGLLWERAGTPYPVTWQEARSHVAALNRNDLRGRRWRLPTVDELITLLSKTPHGTDFCLDSVFDPAQHRLWSCDRCSFISAWYVDAQLGFVHRKDFEAPFYARAVCG